MILVIGFVLIIIIMTLLMAANSSPNMTGRNSPITQKTNGKGSVVEWKSNYSRYCRS